MSVSKSDSTDSGIAGASIDSHTSGPRHDFATIAPSPVRAAQREYAAHVERCEAAGRGSWCRLCLALDDAARVASYRQAV